MSVFKKGDYIVITSGWTSREHLQKNWIHICKRVSQSKYVYVGENANNNTTCFRHATSLEIAEYERLGRPFDVTTLKPKLEVGKWYKAICLNSIYFIKFKEIKNNEIWASEYVHSNSFKIPTGSFGKIGEYKFNTLTDLSEIQQYLPDGHVDKIKTELTIDDLVEGEIYFCKSDGGYIYITESRGGVLMGADIYINDHTYSTELKAIDSAHSFSRSCKWEIRKATSDECQWLNACIEADKFIPKDEALNNEFVLPKYWHTQVTANNRDILSKWRWDRDDYKLELEHIVGHCEMYSGKNHNLNNDKEGFGKEITFDQFKKYVLKDYGVKKEKPKFEFNKWYKKDYFLVYVTKENSVYGLKKNEWFESSGFGLKDFIPATNEEVQSRLIEYAKKKYPVGTKFRTKKGNVLTSNGNIRDYTDASTLLSIYVQENKDRYDSGTILTKNGEWAEIIKEEVKVNLKRGVKCGNQAEWDFVRGIYGNKHCELISGTILRIDIQVGTYDYVSGKAYDVISFQQWLDEFGHNEAWSKVIDADFGEVEPEFKVGDYVWLDKSDIKSLGIVTGFNAGKDCVLVDAIVNNHFGSSKNGWNIGRCTLATNEEVNQANSDYQRETVGNVGLKTITQTSFNRDFYVKVNSQEEANAMFDYLRSQGETTSHENFRNNIDEFVTYSKAYNSWICNSSSTQNVEKPLSDFITIPASTNDSDPLGIIGKKFESMSLGYWFEKYENKQYHVFWENCGGEGALYEVKEVKSKLDDGTWKIIEDEPLVPKEDLYVGTPESWGRIGHQNHLDQIFRNPLTPKERYRPDAIDAMLLQNQLGMIRKNIVPKPKVQELVDAEKYFPKEEEKSLDDLLREV